jgi:hypothetical protein
MKLYRNAIVLIVVLGLLIGAYVVISKTNSNSSSSTTPQGNNKQVMSVTNFNKDDITEIDIANKDQKYVFTKNKDTWKVVTPVISKVDTSKIDAIANDISNIIGLKLIEENASDLSRYGLDKPIKVSAKLKDGSTKAVELGRKTPTEEAYYAKLAGTNKVYTIGIYTGDDFSVTLNDLKDRGVFSSIKSADIKGFTLSKSSSLVFSVNKVTDSNWEITAPIKGSANMDKLSPILDSIPQFSVKEYVNASSGSLQNYGLKTPAYSMNIVTKSGTTKVLLGDEKVKGSEIYAKLGDSSDVFVMDETTLNFIDTPLNSIMDTYLYVASFPDIEHITLNIDGKTIDSKIQSASVKDSKNDKYTVNGKDATGLKDTDGEKLFNKYARTLMALSLSDLEISAKPQGKANITLTYFLKKAPGKVKFEFVSKDSSYYYVVKNDKYTGMLISKSDFDAKGGIRETYKKLLKDLSL